MKTFDINCDCGESYGNWSIGADETLLPLITTANVACGFHAGDPVTLARTVDLAAALGVAVGAHPGLPDLMGFGRRRMEISPEEAYAYVAYQAGATMGLLARHEQSLNHIKPHGALYLMLNERFDLAEAVVRAIRDVCPSPRLYWPAPLAGRALPEVAASAGVTVVPEIYFDLDYDDSLALVLQRKKSSLDTELLRTRLLDYLATGEITATSGRRFKLDAGSICIHGDGPNATAMATTIRDVLREAGYAVGVAA